MSTDVKEFYGKDVAAALKKACNELQVGQERLTVEVIETGSTGIFGLIRKKARIRVAIRPDEERDNEVEPQEKKKSGRRSRGDDLSRASRSVSVKDEKPDEIEQTAATFSSVDDGCPEDERVRLSPENLDLIRNELEKILDLMHCPSTIAVEDIDGTIQCRVGDEYEAELTGQDGRTLDALQYLLRKIVSRKIPGRLRLVIDVGSYRQKRNQELHDRAIEYAALVKEHGKTQVIPALNPSERRIVHIALQNDHEIRSRSVGDGLFKKVLIYKPGSGKGRKNSERRKGRGNNRTKKRAVDGGKERQD
ncbi:MAG: RNA-binding protein [Desulfobacterales bacterium]|nr:MAG: RNA-binding protein [Desulfobacterales bacterium]